MNAISSLRQGLEDVDRQWRAGHFAQALTQVDRLLEEWPSNPHLLVLRAELIQLQDTCEGPTLDDVKADLEHAVELDPDSPAPLIELGHFLLAVEDDAEAAVPCFQRAVDLCVRLLKDAQHGRDQAHQELAQGRPGNPLPEGTS
jgi:predicted Zn-dependent protease